MDSNIIDLGAKLKQRGLPPPITPQGPHHLNVVSLSGNDYLGTLLSKSELLEALKHEHAFLHNVNALDETGPPPDYRPYTIEPRSLMICRDGPVLLLREKMHLDGPSNMDYWSLHNIELRGAIALLVKIIQGTHEHAPN